MERVETVLNGEKFFYQGLCLQKRPASRNAVVLHGVHLRLAFCSTVETSVRKDARTSEKPAIPFESCYCKSHASLTGWADDLISLFFRWIIFMVVAEDNVIDPA